jgi:hypothetical protein
MINFEDRFFIKNKEKKLRDLIKIQRADGNWNYSPYMHGLTNGLLLALSILVDEEPDYLDPPEKWIDEKYNK